MRVELTYNSNAIEGNTLTLRETQLVIEGQSPADRPLREIYEARNHDRALRSIEQRAASKDAITLDDILRTHATVMTDIDATSAGRLRTGRVLIAGSGFIPPGPQKFDDLIPPMLHMANRNDLHAVLAAAELHYNLVAIHPFNDGNGRTARLMMNDLFMRRGYSMCIIDVRQRVEYLRTLDDANGGFLEPFASFIARSAIATIKKMLG